jgi:hypothetical protein
MCMVYNSSNNNNNDNNSLSIVKKIFYTML